MAGGAKSGQDTRTPDEIVRDIEATREQLAETIDTFVDRTSPANVAGRTLAAVKARFFTPDGSPRIAAFAKVGGAVAGLVAVVVVVRQVVGGD